eukprot:1387934-Rhodomonas_salina.3
MVGLPSTLVARRRAGRQRCEVGASVWGRRARGLKRDAGTGEMNGTCIASRDREQMLTFRGDFVREAELRRGLDHVFFGSRGLLSRGDRHVVVGSRGVWRLNLAGWAPARDRVTCCSGLRGLRARRRDQTRQSS